MSENKYITYRLGKSTDSYALFNIFEHTIADLIQRMGSNEPTSIANPETLARMWTERKSLYTHLAQSADQYWVAEREDQLVGFSRSIVRGGLRELTELFVLPGQQSGGVGRKLITLAFPPNGTEFRVIIATPDFRAQTLYLKSGVYPRFPIYYFKRQPQVVNISSDLSFEAINNSPEKLEILGILDDTLLGHRRDVDHTWLLNDRQGYLYYRDGQPVGYGYLGFRNGPFALLDTADFPAVLSHAERQAVKNNQERFGIEVPMINQVAVDYLLSQGFRLDSFMTLMMTNKPFGKFENYILTSPPFFL